MAMKLGVAFVNEEEDEEHFLLARFTCVWDTGEAAHDGPKDAHFQEALAWARDRADEVIVCLGSERFSAGKKRVAALPNLPEPMLPPSRRRDPDYWYLDRTVDDPPIDWPVELDLHHGAKIPGEAASAFVNAIATDPRVSHVRRRRRPIRLAAMPLEEIKDAIQVSALLRARTYGEAEEIVDHLFQKARSAAGQRAVLPDGAVWYGGTGVGAPKASCSGT